MTDIGRSLVLRLDESTLASDGTTLFSDLAFLRGLGVRPIVVAPSPQSARKVVRLMNRSGDTAVGLSGADAGMIPAMAGSEVGAVQTRLLSTLLQAGYVPVIEPLALGIFGKDVAVAPDAVAGALAQAIAAHRAIFFHGAGGVINAQTQVLIDELTPAEALALADDAEFDNDLRAAIRAAALGVRGGVGAAQIVDGRIAHAAIVEFLTARHLGTQVAGTVFYRMTGTGRVALAALSATLVATASYALASSPAFSTGFRSTGTLVVQARVAGSPVNVGGTIAFYKSGSMYRLDLLSLGFPGADPTASALAGALLAPGGATLMYNGATGAVSAYSTGNGVFYEDVPKSAVARPAPAPAAAAGAADPLATLANVARQLHDVERASIQLTGHSATNGHPTDDLDVLIRRRRPGKALEDYHAQVALADDLDGFPVRIAFSSTPATSQDLGGSLQLDLTAVSRDLPEGNVFAIPPGLTRVNSLGEVLQAKH